MKLFFSALTLLCLFLGMGAHAMATPVVLFDEAHTQQFLVSQDGPLGLSGLAKELTDQGCEIKASTEPLTQESLQGVDLLVISGAFSPLTAAEIEAVAAYVETGGGLAIMLHIGPPLRDLLFRFEVDFANGSIRELRNLVDEEAINFKVVDLETHPLMDKLEHFTLYGAWPLRGTAAFAKEIARTSDHAWVDLDRSGELSAGDATQTFAVVVAGEFGQGRFAVFGDDALFQNRFLDKNNRTLARNMSWWLARN